MRHILAGLALATCGAGAAHAAALPPSTVKGSPPGFNFPMSYDSVVADPKNHRVIYEDKHIRLIEVTLWPHDPENTHGHAYSSVFAADDVFPAMTNTDLLNSPGPPPFGAHFGPPDAPEFPHCMTLGPQTPHAATIQENYPQHFYRMEFKKVDPDTFAAHWKTSYPELARRVPAAPPAAADDTKKFSDAWPYSINYETVRAAPANYRLLVDDGHVRVTEVTILPGATTPMVGSPYYSIQAYDTPRPGTPGGPTIAAKQLDGASKLLAKVALGGAGAPKDLDGPTCTVSGPTPPRAITNTGTMPVHYYQWEYLRVDGKDFATKWKEWYPEMVEGPKPQASK